MKKYIVVTCTYDEDGVVTPTAIIWENGRKIRIDKVLHTCKLENEGIRYSVLIGKAKKYIYKENESWYVECEKESE